MPGTKVPSGVLPQVQAQVIPALGDDWPEYPERVWATHPVRRFPTRVTKPGGVTDGTYVITVRGVRGSLGAGVFDDTEMSVVGDTTVLRRAGADQAALHGLLQRIQDLGLELLDVHRESAEPA